MSNYHVATMDAEHNGISEVIESPSGLDAAKIFVFNNKLDNIIIVTQQISEDIETSKDYYMVDSRDDRGIYSITLSQARNINTLHHSSFAKPKEKSNKLRKYTKRLILTVIAIVPIGIIVLLSTLYYFNSNLPQEIKDYYLQIPKIEDTKLGLAKSCLESKQIAGFHADTEDCKEFFDYRKNSNEKIELGMNKVSEYYLDKYDIAPGGHSSPRYFPNLIGIISHSEWSSTFDTHRKTNEYLYEIYTGKKPNKEVICKSGYTEVLYTPGVIPEMGKMAYDIQRDWEKELLSLVCN